MLYKIQHRIHTLSENAIMEGGKPTGFSFDNIEFFHWEFNYSDGWLQDFWLAEGEIIADNGIDAVNSFRKKLGVIIPKVAFISQSYIDFITEPWLMSKEDSDVLLYHHSKDRPGGGLMFMEKDKKVLDLLLEYKGISEDFYRYWKDTVNTTGYSSKLLLMFSAIEALAKDSHGKKDWSKIQDILGDDLTEDLFGTKENSKIGLRHRLVHGEYFNEKDTKKNFLDLIHKSVLNYFNRVILKENLLEMDIVNPQRHPFGNKETGFVFLKQKQIFDLKNVIADFEESGPRNSERYNLIHPDNDFRVNF